MIEIIIAGINIGAIAPIYGYFIFYIFVIFIYQGLKKRKILINGIQHITFWLLLLSGIIFSIHYPNYSGYSLLVCLVLYTLNPPMIYLASHIIATSFNDDEGKIKTVFYAIALGCGIRVILNIIINIGNDRWHLIDFFGKTKMAATNLGSLNIFIFSLLPCIFMEKSLKVKIGGFFLFSCSLIYSFILGTRTQLLAIIFILLISCIVYFFQYFRGRIYRKTIYKIFLSVLFISVLIFISYKFNLFHIKEKILTSNLVNRFSDKETASSDFYRIQLLIKGIKMLFQYPLGGNMEVLYFHNYWLDIGRVAGFLPFILIIFYDIIIIYHIYLILKNKEIDKLVKYAFLCVNLGFYFNFLFEPIMEGYVDLFYRFCLINGITEGLYYKNFKNQRKEVLYGRYISG